MGRLSLDEIKSIVESKHCTLISADDYKNTKSLIKIKCEKGHLIETSIEILRKPSFSCPICIGENTANFDNNTNVPEKNGYRIVALDQASHKIGVSIYDNGRLVYYDWFEVVGTLEQRLKKIYLFLNSEIIYKWKPDFLVFEDIQYQNNALTHKILGMILGICVLSAEINKIPHEEVLNKVWQHNFNILGSTREQQKNNVIKKVKEIYNINVSDDTADAILLGLYATEKLKDKWQEVLF